MKFYFNKDNIMKIKKVIKLFSITFCLLTISISFSQENTIQKIIEQIDPGTIGQGDWNGDEYPINKTVKLPSLPNRDINLRGYVTIPRGVQGPFPVIVLLHGRHNICYINEGSDGFLTTNCGDAFNRESNEIPNYHGFRYIANTLVTHGYVVVSIDSNAIIDAVERDKQLSENTNVPLKIKDEGAQLRAELIQEHLNLLKEFNENATLKVADVPTFNTMDFNNVITMGHSRGGEGVVKHFIHNKNLGSPYKIKGVFSVAPTNTNNFIVPKGMNYSVMIPYCDGDLTQAPGVWNYDRQTENSDSSTHQILLMGANHNYFNIIWTPGNFTAGTSDDWKSLEENVGNTGSFCGDPNNRFSPEKQRNILNAYLHSFIKTYVEKDFRYSDPIFGINNHIPASTQLGNNEVHVSYHAPEVKRMNLNILENSDKIVREGLTSFSICGTGDEKHLCGNLDNDIDKRLDDHYSPEHKTGLPRILVSWNGTTNSKIAYTVSEKQKNISSYTHFTLRAGVTAFPPFQINRVGGNQNFSISIIDDSGKEASTEVAPHTNALFPPPGTIGNITPHNIANTIAIPLSNFNTIDLENIKSITFKFDKTSKGELYFTDFAFTNYNEIDFKEWTGNTNTDWVVNTNWKDNTTPLSTNDVLIPNVITTPVVDEGKTANAKNLVIEESSSLNISEGGAAIIEADFVNKGTVNISSKENKSGVLVVKGTSNGMVTFERSGLIANKWSIITVPVVGQSIKSFIENPENAIRVNTTVTPNRYAVGFYDDTKVAGSKWTYYTADDIQTDALTFERGKGYIISRVTDGSVKFKGTIETEDVNISAQEDKWNAVGNPYTAYMPVNNNTGTNFIQENLSKFNPTNVGVYIWDVTQNKYVAKTLVGEALSLTVGQGFFVKTKEGVSSISFKQKQRLTDATVVSAFSRKAIVPSIQVLAKQGDITVDTNIKYLTNGKKGLDPGYDVENFEGAKFDIFTRLVSGSSKQNFTLQSLPNDNYEKTIIPLGIKSEVGKKISISIKTKNLPAGLDVYIEDKLLGVKTKLNNLTETYQITFDKETEEIGRFFIHTQSKTLAVEEESLIETTQIYTTTDKNVIIKGIYNEKFTVTIFNTLGTVLKEEVYSGAGQNKIKTSNFPIGVYLVNVKSNNLNITKKVILE
ncbi:conserved protein of unknown function precursor containing a type A C-terminal secretion signal [Tenacibaculum sp. 190524A02b]